MSSLIRASASADMTSSAVGTLRGLGQDPLTLFLGQSRLCANLIELSLL